MVDAWNGNPPCPSRASFKKSCIAAADRNVEVVRTRQPFQRAVGPHAEVSLLIINLTTAEGGRFSPSDHDPKVAAEGSTLTLPETRVAHVVALKPDICSLDFNTMNSGANVVINTPKNVRKMAKLIVDAGVLPEIEVFDSSDIHMASDMIADGDDPRTVSLPAGDRGEMRCGVNNDHTGLSQVDPTRWLSVVCIWSRAQGVSDGRAVVPARWSRACGFRG